MDKRDNNRRFRYEIRISEDDKFRINFLREITGKTGSDVIREAVKSMYIEQLRS